MWRADTFMKLPFMQFSFELHVGEIRAFIYLPIIIITFHVDICRLVQLQGHLLSWTNLIIPIKTMFILSVITVIWQESCPLIVHSDTLFMVVSL